jgi:hypothetical protein
VQVDQQIDAVGPDPRGGDRRHGWLCGFRPCRRRDGDGGETAQCADVADRR